jgi:hypothetical protein
MAVLSGTFKWSASGASGGTILHSAGPTGAYVLVTNTETVGASYVSIIVSGTTYSLRAGATECYFVPANGAVKWTPPAGVTTSQGTWQIVVPG